jgi:hypothetical protein
LGICHVWTEEEIHIGAPSGVGSLPLVGIAFSGPFPKDIHCLISEGSKKKKK